MNLLLADDTCSFVPFALRCMRFGHHVRVCMPNDKQTGRQPKTGDGLVEKVREWEKHVDWADLILLSDNERWLRQLDVYKRRGYPVLAPSQASAELELDRKKGQKFLEDHGIKTMPFQSFTNAQKAIAYIEKEGKRFVCKPNNNQARELSYVSKSPADMILMLQRWEEQKMIKGEFLLQEFVEGVEVGVNGWMGPQGFCSYVEENFEHKKLMNENLGPNTGETGTAIKYIARKESDLAKELLDPIEKALVKMGHLGPVDVAVIVDENGDPRPLEFTMRMGWPAWNIVQSLHPDPCQWMKDLIDGKDTFKPLLEHAIGVVVFQPPFPYDDLIKKCGGKLNGACEGIPLYGVDTDNPYFEDIQPCDVMSGKAPAMEGDEVVEKRMLVSTGDYLAVCTGTGDDVKAAKKQAYKCVESMEIPNSVGYRTDIGDRLKKDIPVLQDYGFCESWRY
jgi:phosphoribosylamine--glycine ligase